MKVLKSPQLLTYLSTIFVAATFWAQPLSGARVPTVLMMLLGVGLLIMGKISFNDSRLKRFTTIMALFFVPACLSLINSYDPEGTLKLIVVMPLFLLFAAAMVYLIENKFIPKLFFYVIVVAASFWMFDGIIQLIYGTDLFGIPPWPNDGIRIVGPFGERLRMGLFLSISLPLVLFFLKAKGLIWQLVYLAFALLLIMLTGVRTDMLTALIAIFIYFIANKKAKQVFLLIPVLLLAGFVAANSSSITDSKLHSFSSVPSTYQEWNLLSSHRLDIWLTAKNMFMNHPIIGVGEKSFAEAYDTYATEGNVFTSQSVYHAHHPIISIAAESGLVGLLGLFTILTLLYKWGRCALKDELWGNPWFQILVLIFFPIQSMPLLFNIWWFPFIAMTMLFYLNDIDKALKN